MDDRSIALLCLAGVLLFILVYNRMDSGDSEVWKY